MTKKSDYLILTLLLLFSLPVFSQEKPKELDKKMEWIQRCQIGHFRPLWHLCRKRNRRIVVVLQRLYHLRRLHETIEGFYRFELRCRKLGKTLQRCRRKYAVLTSKHHDGVALWKGNFNHLNVIDHTPAGRDLVRPFVDALRKNDMKVGLYYSLIDWSYPDYPAFTRNSVRYQNDPHRWEKFVNFYFGQVNELSTRYNPDLFWFDGDWEHSAKEWKAAALRKQITDTQSQRNHQ
jgi:alpha-L-fucosidase